jgi:anti-sigma regulatory factor (Ser/Thr protein kinase)
MLDFCLKLTMTSEPRWLCVARGAVRQLAIVCGFTEENASAITLAIDEALSNVIRHAYHNDTGRRLELTCRAEADRLEFQIVDQGEPFDPAKIGERSSDPLKTGGWGLQIIRQVMDDVEYKSGLGENHLRLVKLRPAAPGPECP